MKKDKIAIAIDGPAGAGKSTAARELASKLGIHCLDTGALFRAFALRALENGADPADGKAVVDAISDATLDIELEGGEQRTILNGRDVSGLIRTPEVAKGASDIGTIPEVRRILTERVREIAKKLSIVAEGRDIGTAMLPDADYKFFLTASPETRAARRMKEMLAKGERAEFPEVLEQIIQRDKNDSSRKIAPLKKAEDAFVIDSTDLSADQVLDLMLERISRG